VTFGIMIPCCL